MGLFAVTIAAAATKSPTTWMDVVEKFGITAALLAFFVWWTYTKDKKDREREEKREKAMADKLDAKDEQIDRQTEFVQKEMLEAINNNTNAQKDVSRALGATNAQQRQTIASLEAIAKKLDMEEAVAEALRKETDTHHDLGTR